MTEELPFAPLDLQVVKTFAIEEQQEVFLLRYFRDHDQTANTLVVTGHHPFWVKNVGWTAAEELRPARVLELHDGTEARVFNIRRILKTGIPDVGWTHDDGGEVGPTIDLRDGFVKVEPPIASMNPRFKSMSTSSEPYSTSRWKDSTPIMSAKADSGCMTPTAGSRKRHELLYSPSLSVVTGSASER